MARLLHPLVLVAVFAVLALAQGPESKAAKGGMMMGKHPHIHHAIHALEKAKGELQSAAHDFGGHRVSAIGTIDAALNELKAALQFADGKKGGAGKKMMMKKM